MWGLQLHLSSWLLGPQLLGPSRKALRTRGTWAGCGQYLSVKAAVQAWARRPRPVGECRHQAATERRKSPRLGECTPRSNPPLRGSQIPGAGRVRRGGHRAETCHRPSRVSPHLSHNCPQSQPNFHPKPPSLAITSGLTVLSDELPHALTNHLGQRPCWSLPPHPEPSSAPHLEADIAAFAAQTGEEKEDEGQ